MKKEIYTEIKKALLAVEGIHSVKLWNNKIMDGIDTIDRFPLHFLEFAGLDYTAITGRVQECNNPRLVVHILYQTIDDEDEGVFDYSQAVFSALQNQGFERTGEVPIYSGGEVIDWQITFSAPRFEDYDAKTKYIIIPAVPVDISAQE